MPQQHCVNTYQIKFLDFSEAIYAHVYAKVFELYGCHDSCEKITQKLIQNDRNSIFKMLENPEFLQYIIDQDETATVTSDILNYSKQEIDSDAVTTEETLADEVFSKVSSIEVEIPDHITGMLLEMDMSCLQELMESDQDFQDAVVKAKSVYEETFLRNYKENIADQIYTSVENIYNNENIAQKVTGMLLEIGVNNLQELVKSPVHLKDKIVQAYSALQSDNELEGPGHLCSQTCNHLETKTYFNKEANNLGTNDDDCNNMISTSSNLKNMKDTASINTRFNGPITEL